MIKHLGLMITIVALIISVVVGAVGWSLNAINQSKMDQVKGYQDRIEKVESQNNTQDIRIESLSVKMDNLKEKIEDNNKMQKEILDILRGGK